MPTVVSSVPRQRYDRFGIHFPIDWEVRFLVAPYTDEEMIRACEGADYLFTMSAHPVTENAIREMPSIKLIQVEGVGYEKVHMEAANAAGITVCNNRGVNSGAVAEHTIALFLVGLRRISAGDAQIRSEGYAITRNRFMVEGYHELASRNVGLIGFGDIGKEVAARLKGWGCEICYFDVVKAAVEIEEEYGVNYLELNALLAGSDIVSLHVPALPSTLHIIAAPQLKKMKKTALLVNTARGELVDSMALVKALEAGEIYAAALDTFETEPMPAGHPLLNLSAEAAKRLTLTPHIAGITDEAFARMVKNSILNMQKVEWGESPDNIVSR